MPFLSKDWRSPGEKWVRHEGGWEMKKTVWTSQSLKRASSRCQPRELSVSCPQTQQLRPRHWDDDRLQQQQKDCDAFEPVVLRPRPRRCKVHVVERRNRFNDNFSLREEIVVAMDDDESSAESDATTTSTSCASPQTTAGLTTNNLNTLQPAFSLQPFFPITLKNTREVMGFNQLAEAMHRLDFVNAIKDVRRFTYVSQVVYTLCSHERLLQLSGSAQKLLFRLVEAMADTVYETNCGQHVLRKVLDELNGTMSIYHCWGSHLGGEALFRQHLDTRRRITEMVEDQQVRYKQDLATLSNDPRRPLMNLISLPEECLREIVLRLSDPSDVERAGDTCTVLSALARERRVWRELVQAHFTQQQLDFVRREQPNLERDKQWKTLYKTLRRKFGIKQEYAELTLCRVCRSLYWQSIGHPCLSFSSDDSSASLSSSSGSGDESQQNNANLNNNNNNKGDVLRVPVPPQRFLTFFSV